MTTVADLAAWLEQLAPTWLAEPWDNVGLLLGDPASPCARVMTCLTVTPATADEALAGRADLVVSHHPILFRGAKSLRADRPDTGPAWRLARGGVAVYSPHTAFDNAERGINAGLARRLGLVDVGPLRASAARPMHKVVVFCPRGDREPVLAAAFAAGAGRIGAYGECSYSSPGVGTFFGDESTNPAVGERGRREAVREWRVEVICPSSRLPGVLEAVRRAHSYEEPAIDVYPVEPGRLGPGVGRLGRLAEPETLGALAARVARTLGAGGLQFAGDPSRRVERVALACGAADEFLPDAARAGADVFLTGEARFHRALEAEALGLGLILAGHHATERPGVEDLADLVGGAFPALEAWASRRERDPLRGLG
jgi:dinuclear metal center YbgI/SA1388 family protein